MSSKSIVDYKIIFTGMVFNFNNESIAFFIGGLLSAPPYIFIKKTNPQHLKTVIDSNASNDNDNIVGNWYVGEPIQPPD